MIDSASEQPRHSNDPAESLDDDHNTSRDSDDTLIASPGEDGTAERPTPSVFQNIPVKKQNNGSELISVGPRPLMLGTFQIATLSPATSSNSRPASSLPPAPRTPTSPSARWSSYTPPLTPLSPISSSPILDEVEFLKAQLAASEAMVKVLMKEKFEAVSASRRLTVDLKNLQDQQSQWSKEKEEIMAKLRAVDEDEVTLPLSPPSEGAWFGGSSKTRQLPKKQPILPPLASISGHDRDMQTPPPEAPQLPEVRVSPPGSASSDDHSESALNEIYDTSSENSPRTSAGEETLSRIGTIFLDSAPFDDGCDPSNNPSNNPSPTTTPTASYFPSIEYLSPSSCLSPPPNARRWSHQRGAAIDGSQFIPPTVQYVTPPSQISLSNSSPRTSFNALGVSSIPGSPLHLLVPLSTRSVTPPPQIRPPRPDLMALAYQLIGMDPCSGYPGRQVLHAHARSLLTEGNGTASTGPSINLATALDLHAPMTRVAASTGRPRSATSSPIWLANNEPQIELYLNPLRRSASTTGPKTRYSFSSLGRASLRRSSTNRRSASVNEHATVESLRKRPSPLRMRSFMPSSSPLVTAPVDSGETQPKKKTRLSKLLEQGRSLVSRIV